MSKAAAGRAAKELLVGWCEKCSRRLGLALRCGRCRARICVECVFAVEVKERLCIQCQIEEDYRNE
ncbi:MAG TPA: hypothetical protein VGX48_17780 [Pyrinomonadaceae bacterium]|jgi:hypothetical protein|nr:hypothetical protein [Pyrinomonadaceae bacterium]